MAKHGFCITKKGLALQAKLNSGSTLKITKVAIGRGKLPDDADPRDLEDLISTIAEATSTVPITKGTTTSFIVEYRNNMGEGLDHDELIDEYGVFAADPDDGPVMIYYGSLGDYPEPVAAYTPGDPVITRRYPVSIGVAEGTTVVLGYPAGAMMTAEDIEEQKGTPGGIASLDAQGRVEERQRAIIDDADGETKYTLGVENGKLYIKLYEED